MSSNLLFIFCVCVCVFWCFLFVCLFVFKINPFPQITTLTRWVFSLRVIFGGCKNCSSEAHSTSQLLNDLQFLRWQSDDPYSSTWTSSSFPLSSAPPARYSHSAAIIGNMMLVYGGLTVHHVLNDLWVYSFDSDTWKQRIPLAGDAWPPPLANAAHMVTSDPLVQMLLLSGGQMSTNRANLSSDTWVIFDDLVWTRVDVANSINSDTNNNNNNNINTNDNNNDNYLPSSSSRIGTAASFSNGTLFMYGGQSADTLLEDTMQLTLGCNSGSFSPVFGQTPCRPCERGFYSSDAGATSCAASCSVGVTTPTEGSTSKQNCTVCKPGVCEHGKCVVSSTGVALCNCDTGYRGESCNVPLLLISVAVIVGAMLSALLFFALFRWVRQKTYKLAAENERAKRQYEIIEAERQRLEHGQQINWAELEFSDPKKLLGHGQYGEVISKKNKWVLAF